MLLALWAGFHLAVIGADAPMTAAGPPDFLREVRPILSGHCFKCHGPDEPARKQDLRFDVREEAMKARTNGRPALVPGKPAQSEMIRRVFATSDKEIMPPPGAKLPLSDAQKDILRRWVESGAEYRPHWAFTKPVAPPRPRVKHTDWPRNDVDFFVLARLEKEGLAPSETADPYTLVRRVSLDLTGLPPTVEEAETFVNDAAPEAYEKLVDRLLASPHYGERWARRWMDLARYADTNGYEKDRPRSIWPWRDWLIRALNADMPFDQFTVEQIAGDLLPGATLDQRIATGFHRNSMLNEEGGSDPQEYRFLSLVDRVGVTSTTWLGLTMACAQCHTHKYDPITQRDYYRFMAFLNNADEPVLGVPKADETEQRQKQEERIAALTTELPGKFPAELKAEWQVAEAPLFKAEGGANAERLADGSLLVSGKRPEKETYTVTFETAWEGITHLRLETLPDPSLKANGPGRADDGSFVLSELVVAVQPQGDTNAPQAVKLERARADFWQEGSPPRLAVDGKNDGGWIVAGKGDWHVAHTLDVTLAEPVRVSGGAKVQVTLRQQSGKFQSLGRFRISLGRELPDARPLAERQRENFEAHFNQWLAKEIARPVRWTALTPTNVNARVATLAVEADHTVFAGGDLTKSDTYTVGLTGDWQGATALRLEVLPDPRLPEGGPGRVAYEGPNGNFWLSNFKLTQGTKVLRLASASDSFAEAGNTAAKAIDDDLQSGWSVAGGQGRAHSAVFILEKPLAGSGEITVEMLFEKYYAAALGRFRLWATRETNAVALAHSDDVHERLLKLRQWRRDDTNAAPPAADLPELQAAFAAAAPELIDERDEIKRLRRELPKPPTTLVMQERPADHQRPTFVHKRGDFLQPTERVEPGVPAVLPDLPPGAARDRLALARWLVSPDNPLTARVVMNRQWQAFCGRGLVHTTEDFGFQGELPSHPDLLDWLAVEFVQRGWSLKQMHKLIVMSATYRQSSRATAEARAQDPDNVLLSRGPRFRMDAELVRDAALRASGMLADPIGGPSVYPPQPANVTTEGAYGPLEWKTSEGPDRYRRGLYTFAKRTAPFAMFNAFDAPSGEACIARRDRANTPLQALTLLNDDMFQELARALGRSAAGGGGTVAERVTQLFRRCLTRPPTAEEQQSLVAFFEQQQARFEKGELNAAEFMGVKESKDLPVQAAWAATARVLLNLDEAITKS